MGLRTACRKLFYRKIVFIDETHFWLNWCVIKQNCRMWTKKKPGAIQESPMHPEKCTFWCGLNAGSMIGPYFFKDDQNRNVTVNGACYRAMISVFFFARNGKAGFVDMWFQQDASTCHTSCESVKILRYEFGEQFISWIGPVNWTPRSCDWTPLDYFLLGSLVYADKPTTIPALEDNITRVNREIPAEMLGKVTRNWTFHMDHLKRSRGQHLNDIFKK